MMEQLGIGFIERIRQEIKRKRDAAITLATRQADAEAKIAYDALDVLAGLFNASTLSEAPTEKETAAALSQLPLVVTPSPEPERRAYPTAKWVRAIIANLNGSVISQPIVFEKLIELHPELASREPVSVKSQISAILKKMTANGDLVMEKESHGGEAAEYRRTT